ncbi:MAG: hypothetical protein CM15mP46_1180 [Alphaproteobacteria bacterium]|nr:MAG: hypothetical protein CM15mP46_1180 [Alphaproteobacteria bacterium]
MSDLIARLVSIAVVASFGTGLTILIRRRGAGITVQIPRVEPGYSRGRWLDSGAGALCGRDASPVWKWGGGPNRYLGARINGKRLGIVGMGRIGGVARGAPGVWLVDPTITVNRSSAARGGA